MAHGADGDPDEVLHEGEGLGLGHLLSLYIQHHVPYVRVKKENESERTAKTQPKFNRRKQFRPSCFEGQYVLAQGTPEG